MKPSSLLLITVGFPYLVVSAVCFSAVAIVFTFMRIFSLLNLIIGTPILMLFEKIWPDDFPRRTIKNGFKFCIENIRDDCAELYEKFRLN